MSGIFYGGATVKTSRQVATYAALRATTGPEQSIEVTGYLVTAKPSGIAGVFVRDDADVASNDDGGLVIVRGDGVRFKRQFNGPVSVRFFDTPTDGTTSASAGIQRLITLCETGLARHVYVPNWSENYLISAVLSFISPGVRLFGDQGATYNRGATKKGWLIGASGLPRMVDLGASRTTGNVADNWQVDHIGLRQDAAAAVRSIDGIGFTSRTNGPDRGAIIRSASFIGLKDAITVENADLETSLANLNIEGSVFQACDSAINAKGNLLGLRFVGNQCEQNSGAMAAGVLRGSINGTVTITDNMLEGQPNVLSIDIPPVTGNNPQVEFSRNYLEGTSGDYVVRFRNSTSGASLKVGPNFSGGAITAADYVLFDASTGGTVRLDLQDIGQTFTFKDSGQVVDCHDAMVRGSQLAFYMRKFTVDRLPTVIVHKFQGLTDSAATHVRGLPGSGTRVATPWGKKLCVVGASRINAPVAVVAGDLVSINMLVSLKEVVAGTILFQVLNPALSLYVAEGAAGYNKLNGEWALVNKTFVAKNDAASLEIRTLISSGTYEIYTAGVAVKNYGAFVNDGSTRQLISMVAPNVTDIEFVESVDLPSIASGASYTHTMATTITGGLVGDVCLAQLATAMGDVSAAAWIDSAGVGKVKFTNSNASARDFASFPLTFRVLR